MNSKLTAEGIMGAAMRMSAELSGGEFPISIFPHKIQRIITELHASQGYPIDYIAAAMLSALAVSIGNSHLAQVKRGWRVLFYIWHSSDDRERTKATL